VTPRARVVLASCALALLAAAPSRAALDVAWDCYLPSGQVGCSTLETAVFGNGAYVRALQGAADASINVRAAPVAGGIAYTFVVTEANSSGGAFTFVDRVPTGFSHDAVLVRLVGDVQKVTAHLFALDEPATFKEGRLTLKLRDPDEGPRKARSDDESTRWYVAPSLNFNGERFGIFFVNASANVDVNWSHPDWRVKGDAWTSYRLVIADPDPDDPDEDPADLRYENFDVGIDAYVIRSWGGFSLAANGYAIRDPRSNYALRSGTNVGVEWVLVPFLKTDEGNVGVQYIVGPERQDYVYESVERTMTLTYLRHRARLFGAWHFQHVDLEGSTTFQAHVFNVRFSSVSAYGSVTWRLLDDLSIGMNGEVSYRNALLNEPRDTSQLHPLEAFYGGGAYGDVTYWSWVGVTYTFGNSLLARQDQRWK
jgi:hypothetical protein